MRRAKFFGIGTGLVVCVLAWALDGQAILSEDGFPVPPAHPRNLAEAMRAAGPADRIPVIITFSTVPTDADYAMLERAVSFNPARKYKIIPGAAATLTRGQINALSRMDIVERIELDKILEYHLDTATHWFGADSATDDFGVDGTGVTVAILDSGIDGNHVDFSGGKIVAWMDFSVNPPSSDWPPYDDLGHGTHVASIAAGAGLGDPACKGVAYGAYLVGARVGDAQNAYVSWAISALEWIVVEYNPSQSDPAMKVRVLNMSFGTDDPAGSIALSEATDNAIDAGIVVCASAGNGGPEESTVNASPASVDRVISVGNMGDVGENGFLLRSSSSRGPTADGIIKPDICGPGYHIMAAKAGTLNEYTSKTGTSMSSPFVAGVVALMLQANPALTPAEVKTTLMETAIDWGQPGTDIDYGAGRLDGYAALASVSSPSGTPVGPPDVPFHFYAYETIAARRSKDDWTISLTDATYPMAITLIIPEWISRRDPDFDISLYDPNGAKVASTRGDSRQDNIAYVPVNTGTYMLEVKSTSGSGPYFFDLSAGAAEVVLLNDDDPGEVHDVAVASIEVPSEVLQGNTASVDVVVKNEGTFTETTTVTLTDTPPGGGSAGTISPGPQDVTLSAGGSQMVTFTWNTTAASLGTHTLRAEASVVEGETETADNAKDATVDVVEEQGILYVKVETDKPSYGTGEWVHITVTVTENTETGISIEGSSVHIEITTASGKSYGEDDTTDANGQAFFDFKVKNPDGIGTYAVAADASKAGYVPGSGSTTFEVTSEAGAPALVSSIYAIELGQVYPNPFNPETWIPFTLSKAEHVVIRIYNITGELVRTLNLGQKAPGVYVSKDKAAHWDGRDESGEKVASGIYFYKLEAGDFRQTRKMTVLR